MGGDSFLAEIRLVMGIVDAKDPFTAGHSERVGAMARDLAMKMGLPMQAVEDIHMAGLLHDVGKLAIPDAILFKPGRLAASELEIIRRHPTLGEKLMSPISLPNYVMQGITQHHERLDGKGYPYAISNGEIGLAGRILKVVDVYDALRSKRQYKEPFSRDKAFRILAEGVGTEFDPRVVGVFLEHPFAEPPNWFCPSGASYKRGHTSLIRRILRLEPREDIAE